MGSGSRANKKLENKKKRKTNWIGGWVYGMYFFECLEFFSTLQDPLIWRRKIFFRKYVNNIFYSSICLQLIISFFSTIRLL